MARRRSRRSPIESFLNHAVAWLVALVVLFIVVWVVFESAPGLGLFLFVVLPVAVVVSVVWFRRRAHKAVEHEAAEQARQHVEAARHLGPLLMGSAQDFELAVAAVLRAYGYDLRRVGRSGDGGVDLTGTDADGRKVIVQCKRYGRDYKVGSPAVQSFIGAVVTQGAYRGIFVTTSTYTRQAHEQVMTSPIAVSLVDGEQLTQMAAVAAEQATANPTVTDPAQPSPPVVPLTEYPTWTK